MHNGPVAAWGLSMELLLVIWFVGSLVVGVIATARNRSGFAWFVLGLLLSPLLMGLLVALVPRGDSGHDALTAETHRHCPECREVVRVDARRCKHCRSTIEPITSLPG